VRSLQYSSTDGGKENGPERSCDRGVRGRKNS